MVGCTSATADGTVLPIVVGDDGRTFRSAVTDRDGEADVCEELLHLLVERRTADDNLIQTAAECLIDLLAYLRLQLAAYKRGFKQCLDGGGGNFRQNLLLDDFLDDERHGNDDARLDIGKGLGNDGGRRDAGEIVDVAAGDKLIDELERHTVHVRHRKDGNRLVARMDMLAQIVMGEIKIAPHGTVREHYSFGESRRAGSVVDEGKVVRVRLTEIFHMFLAEILRILLAEKLVQMLACISELGGAGNED